MARMWPVDGVIAESGGIFLRRTPDGQGIVRKYGHSESAIKTVAERLDAAAHAIRQEVRIVRLADDQVFRLTSIAFLRPQI
jgi:hypothetical protein